MTNGVLRFNILLHNKKHVTTGRGSSCQYSQRVQSLHYDHEVQGVQWVLAYHLIHPFQQVQQVRVVPKVTDGEKTLISSTKDIAGEDILMLTTTMNRSEHQDSLFVQKVQQVQ